MSNNHHLLEEPLVPGKPPMLTRVLAVGGDAARLHRLATNLGLRGYQVKTSIDPAAAMAGLREDCLLGRLTFHAFMVDRSSEYPAGGRAAAGHLFEFAVREPQIAAYAIDKDDTFGPLAMEDLDKFMKPIYKGQQNGPKSPEATLNGPCNTSPATTTSTTTNFSFTRRMAGMRIKKHISDGDRQEVEQDVGHAERDQKQPSQKPKTARVVWTDELHQKFLDAYNTLPPGAAVPKRILGLMDDRTLTREIIASHLQKHRLNLEREACTNPLPRSHSKTKHHRSTPQASFPSPDMSSQQRAPPTVMQPGLSATVYINYGTTSMNAHTMLEASTKSGMQDSSLVIRMKAYKATDKSNKSAPVDVPPKDMHPGADDHKHSSVHCVGNADDNGLPEDISDILNKEPGPSWDDQFWLSSGD